MKKLLLLSCLIWFVGCNNDEETSEYTGRQVKYDLLQSSDFPIFGDATFLERKDGMVELRIELTGTEAGLSHPAHLHHGDVSIAQADVALMLTQVDGATGESITLFNMFVDETPITYEELLTFDGHIKVHLDGGANKSTILASGNVGTNGSK